MNKTTTIAVTLSLLAAAAMLVPTAPENPNIPAPADAPGLVAGQPNETLATAPAEAKPTVTLGRVARFEGFGRIGAGGATVSTTLDIVQESEGVIKFDLSGHCENWLLAIGVSGTATVALEMEDGSVYRQVRLEIPETPGRGWPWNPAPGRGASISVPFTVGTAGLAKIKTVHWQFFDRAAPSPVDLIQDAAGLALCLL